MNNVRIDPNGFWDKRNIENGKVIIPSNRITMKGVNFPVLGVSDTGDMKVMLPNGEYEFNGNNVTEYKMEKGGKTTIGNTSFDMMDKFKRTIMSPQYATQVDNSQEQFQSGGDWVNAWTDAYNTAKDKSREKFGNMFSDISQFRVDDVIRHYTNENFNPLLNNQFVVGNESGVNFIEDQNGNRYDNFGSYLQEQGIDEDKLKNYLGTKGFDNIEYNNDFFDRIQDVDFSDWKYSQFKPKAKLGRNWKYVDKTYGKMPQLPSDFKYSTAYMYQGPFGGRAWAFGVGDMPQMKQTTSVVAEEPKIPSAVDKVDFNNDWKEFKHEGVFGDFNNPSVETYKPASKSGWVDKNGNTYLNTEFHNGLNFDVNPENVSFHLTPSALSEYSDKTEKYLENIDAFTPKDIDENGNEIWHKPAYWDLYAGDKKFAIGGAWREFKEKIKDPSVRDIYVADQEYQNSDKLLSGIVSGLTAFGNARDASRFGKLMDTQLQAANLFSNNQQVRDQGDIAVNPTGVGTVNPYNQTEIQHYAQYGGRTFEKGGVYHNVTLEELKKLRDGGIKYKII